MPTLVHNQPNKMSKFVSCRNEIQRRKEKKTQSFIYYILSYLSGFKTPESHEVNCFDRSAFHLQVKVSEQWAQQVARKSNLSAVIDLVRQALSLGRLNDSAFFFK